ncbi:MAG: hypothetical protein AVDCRST_MAG69-2575, partial [uncultured Solirubrobacteraceae bacterium]
ERRGRPRPEPAGARAGEPGPAGAHPRRRAAGHRGRRAPRPFAGPPARALRRDPRRRRALRGAHRLECMATALRRPRARVAAGARPAVPLGARLHLRGAVLARAFRVLRGARGGCPAGASPGDRDRERRRRRGLSRRRAVASRRGRVPGAGRARRSSGLSAVDGTRRDRRLPGPGAPRRAGHRAGRQPRPPRGPDARRRGPSPARAGRGPSRRGHPEPSRRASGAGGEPPRRGRPHARAARAGPHDRAAARRGVRPAPVSARARRSRPGARSGRRGLGTARRLRLGHPSRSRAHQAAGSAAVLGRPRADPQRRSARGSRAPVAGGDARGRHDLPDRRRRRAWIRPRPAPSGAPDRAHRPGVDRRASRSGGRDLHGRGRTGRGHARRDPIAGRRPRLRERRPGCAGSQADRPARTSSDRM